MTNKEFSETNRTFITACWFAKIIPTTRQASKWRNGKGIARQLWPGWKFYRIIESMEQCYPESS
jgi:hypothetical protein